MDLVTFIDDKGEPLVVNPALVRVLRPSTRDPKNNTALYFDDDHTVVVVGPLGTVAHQLSTGGHKPLGL